MVIVQNFAESLERWDCEMKRTLAFNDRGCRVGETHHRAKLTDADIDQILELRELGLSYRQIAEKFDDIPGGISKSTVRDIVKCRIRAQTPASFKVRIAD